jgi:broad specificity phosphatase PhoE
VASLKKDLLKPGQGDNLVLVSHGSTIQALTGISPGTGGMVVVTPQGGGRFALAGSLEVE